jgi:exosortase family protein XrtF
MDLGSMPHGTRAVTVFAAKAVAVYVVWYCVYDLWLLPDGRLDTMVSRSTASTSRVVLNTLGFGASGMGRLVRMAGTPGVEIVNGCNGLSTIGLFLGFVLAYPGAWWRRVVYVPVGAAVIYATNVLRIVIMVLVQHYWPAAFAPLHGFGLTTIFYVVVFVLWMGWVHYGGAHR